MQSSYLTLASLSARREAAEPATDRRRDDHDISKNPNDPTITFMHSLIPLT
jgi:hypothetical protein